MQWELLQRKKGGILMKLSRVSGSDIGILEVRTTGNRSLKSQQTRDRQGTGTARGNRKRIPDNSTHCQRRPKALKDRELHSIRLPPDLLILWKTTQQRRVKGQHCNM
jgi:hypothetical protein